MKKISSIALWILLAVSVIVILLVLAGGSEPAQLSTGAETTAPIYLDVLLYWIYITVIVGVVCLLVFACKSLATQFAIDKKAALKSLGTVLAFVLLMVICYVVSPEQEFSRIVNGEVETYSQPIMKMIDMWLYSMYILLAATVVLVVVFAVKRMIGK